jgi:hypothetical protein
MISTVQDDDLEEIRNLIAAAVKQNVTSLEEDATFVIDDIGQRKRARKAGRVRL